MTVEIGLRAFQAAFTLAAFILSDPTETPHALRWNLICELNSRLSRILQTNICYVDEAFPILKPRPVARRGA